MKFTDVIRSMSEDLDVPGETIDPALFEVALMYLDVALIQASAAKVSRNRLADLKSLLLDIRDTPEHQPFINDALWMLGDYKGTEQYEILTGLTHMDVHARIAALEKEMQS